MLINFFIYFIFLLFSSSLFAINHNVRHKPEDIFAITPHGEVVINPKRTTGIDILHSKGFMGRRSKVAIVDVEIHPDLIEKLKSNIHPNVFQHKYVLTPEEHLEKLSIPTLKAEYDQNVDDYNALSFLSQLKQKNEFAQKINKIAHQIIRKEYFDEINNYNLQDFQKGALHGVSTLSLLHHMAPQCQLFPFDIGALSSAPIVYKRINYTNPFVVAVEEAIKCGVDAISLSCTPSEFSRDFINVLKEAIHKGIAIIFAAGNASNQNQPIYVDKQRLDDGTFIKSGDYSLFEETKREGILFAGSLAYNPANGEEVYSKFSQHPTQFSLNHHILAPGESIFLNSVQNRYGVYSGTSLSAPITAAGFAVLKDYATAKGLSYTRDNLLSILQQSGHKLRHNIPGASAADSYNVLNLSKAVFLADKTLIKKHPVIVKPSPVIKRSPTLNPPKTSVKKKQATYSKKRGHALKKKKVSRHTRKKNARATRRKAVATRKAQTVAKRRAVQEAKKKAILKRKLTKKKRVVKRRRAKIRKK